MQPIKIEDGEWYHKGCLIQLNEHPNLLKYSAWQDKPSPYLRDSFSSFHGAKSWCEENKVPFEDQLSGLQAFMPRLKVYKLVRQLKDGSLAPLFINKTMRLPLNEWLEAEDHPTKGYAHRKGWHCTLSPKADHLSKKNRVWVEVVVEDYELVERPENQGGTWALAQRMKVIKILN